MTRIRTKRSPEMLAKAIAMAKDGERIEAIAEEIGVDVTTMRIWLKPHGLVKPKYRTPPEKIQRAVALRAQGLAHKEISAKLGVSTTTVSDWLLRHEGKSTRYQKREEAARAVRENHKTDYPAVLRKQADETLATYQMPKDTRDITGRFCGDPLPGRSALDKMRGAQ